MKLVILYESTSLSVDYPEEAAKLLMREWLAGTIAGRFGFNSADNGELSAVVRGDKIVAMYLHEPKTSAQERIAAAVEKQLADGEDWKG